MALTPYKRACFQQALMRKVASAPGLRKEAAGLSGLLKALGKVGKWVGKNKAALGYGVALPAGVAAGTYGTYKLLDNTVTPMVNSAGKAISDAITAEQIRRQNKKRNEAIANILKQYGAATGIGAGLGGAGGLLVNYLLGNTSITSNLLSGALGAGLGGVGGALAKKYMSAASEPTDAEIIGGTSGNAEIDHFVRQLHDSMPGLK